MPTDLSQFGLGPPDGPTTVPAPGSSAAAAVAQTTPPAIPGFNRLRIDVVQIGDILLPPSPTSGRAILKFTRKIKDDKKSGAGKTPSASTASGAAGKTTVTAIEPAEGTLLLNWTRAAHKKMRENLARLQPGAGPFTISHDNADLYNVSSVLVTEWSDGIEWNEFQIASLTIKLREIPGSASLGALLLYRGKTDKSVSFETGGLGTREVSRWQEFLIAQGFTAELGASTADGIFGEKTATATKAFQTREACNLIDGIVGPETFGKAAKFGYAPPPAVKVLGGGGVKTAGAAKDKVPPAATPGTMTPEQRRAYAASGGTEDGPDFQNRGPTAAQQRALDALDGTADP